VIVKTCLKVLVDLNVLSPTGYKKVLLVYHLNPPHLYGVVLGILISVHCFYMAKSL
jgi:hypothetical protein